jgi:hypothetical protein
MNKRLPIFLHIPKSAGTYIVTGTQTLLEQNCNPQLLVKNFLVDIPNSTLLRVFCAIDNETLFQIQSRMTYKIDKLNAVIDFDEFLDFVRAKSMQILSMVIEPGYFWGCSKFSTNLLPCFSAAFKICSIYNINYSCYTIFRPIAERCKSIYSYLRSQASSHEPNHQCINSSSFEEHVNSEEFETNWICRSILGCESMNESRFVDVCGLLSKFHVYNILQADQCIDDIFGLCFEANNIKLDKQQLNKNKNKQNPQIINHNLIDAINQKNTWDYRLYKKFS